MTLPVLKCRQSWWALLTLALPSCDFRPEATYYHTSVNNCTVLALGIQKFHTVNGRFPTSFRELLPDFADAHTLVTGHFSARERSSRDLIARFPDFTDAISDYTFTPMGSFVVVMERPGVWRKMDEPAFAVVQITDVKVIAGRKSIEELLSELSTQHAETTGKVP